MNLLKTIATITYNFSSYVIVKFNKDHCFETASALAYTTLVSIVPLMAVSVFIVKGMPFFQGLWSEVQQYIFIHFLPSTGKEVEKYLKEFLENTSHLSIIGGISLIFSSMILIYTIENAFNRIWHVRLNRTFLNSFLLYWAILTLTPILMGVSFGVSSYLWSLAIMQYQDQWGINLYLIACVPFILTSICFTSLYLLIPNCRVKFLHALFGGLVAALFFEISKKIFAIYVSGITLNAVIYGAFAAIPFFILWIYIACVITLFGAELASAIPLFFHQKK